MIDQGQRNRILNGNDSRRDGQCPRHDSQYKTGKKRHKGITFSLFQNPFIGNAVINVSRGRDDVV